MKYGITSQEHAKMILTIIITDNYVEIDRNGRKVVSCTTSKPVAYAQRIIAEMETNEDTNQNSRQPYPCFA